LNLEYPPHGGSDPGTVQNGLQEKDINLGVSLALGNLLSNQGHEVFYTRSTDIAVPLLQRSQVAASVNADLFLSIHVNSGGGQGVEAYYSITDSTPRLANVICDDIASLGFRNRGAKTRVGSNGDYYSVIRETVRLSNAKPYLVEMFFLDSSTDRDLYQQVGNQGLAQAIARAVNTVYRSDIGDQSSTGVYIVKAGDTLYSIARRYNTTVSAIRSLNGLTSNFIFVGQRLQIPSSQKVYTVRLGDTLYSIAKQFNTTVDRIMRDNNLSSNILSVGMQLVIM